MFRTSVLNRRRNVAAVAQRRDELRVDARIQHAYNPCARDEAAFAHGLALHIQKR
jgi:hypothetical protein